MERRTSGPNRSCAPTFTVKNRPSAGRTRSTSCASGTSYSSSCEGKFGSYWQPSARATEAKTSPTVVVFIAGLLFDESPRRQRPAPQIDRAEHGNRRWPLARPRHLTRLVARISGRSVDRTMKTHRIWLRRALPAAFGVGLAVSFGGCEKVEEALESDITGSVTDNR